MRKACKYVVETPDGRIVQQFEELKKMYGYEMAKSIWRRVNNPDYAKVCTVKVEYDSDGFVTLNTLLRDKSITNFVGEQRAIQGLEKTHKPVEDTRANFIDLMEQSADFNNNNPMNDRFVAMVGYRGNGKIGLVFKVANEENIKKSTEQFSTYRLNIALENIFRPLGITIDDLYESEKNNGRVGYTDFRIADRIGKDFISMVRVANNMEGAMAISEEFSHLIVGALRNDPIVARSLNILKSDQEAVKEILGEKDYNKTRELNQGKSEEEIDAIVAEEALGHILKRNLIEKQDKKVLDKRPTIRRMIDRIVEFFRELPRMLGLTATQIDSNLNDAVNSAEVAMSKVASDILSGARKISKEDIMKSKADYGLNALSDRIDRNIEILKKAIEVEVKRYKIFGDDSTGKTKSLIRQMQNFSVKDADTVQGIFEYAKQALETLKSLQYEFTMFDIMDQKQKFKFLRSVNSYIQSYASFINELTEALSSEEEEEDNMFLKKFNVNGKEIDVESVIKELNHHSKKLTRKYYEMGMAAFAEFLKPFLGETITYTMGDLAGKTFKVEDLLKCADQDITFVDRWLQSMGNSSDVILQGFDLAVKKAKDAATDEFFKFRDRVNIFREKCEKAGIRDFEWAFEKDEKGNKTGRYISGLDYARFDKEYKEMLQKLDEKYGKNAHGEDALNKIEERNTWLETHARSKYGKPIPNSSYRNAAYYALSQTQRDLLNEFQTLKFDMDKLYDGKVDTSKAIQRRKAKNERFWESATSASKLLENVKESISANLLDRQDDNLIFGDTQTAKSITDFGGREYMILPALYTSDLENPNEISTDLIGTLLSYGYAALTYKHVDEIVDAIETGKSIIEAREKGMGRETLKTRGGKKLQEKFSALGIQVVNDIFADGGNVMGKLQDFMEAQVYGRQLKDQGTFGKSKLNKQKTTTELLKWSSMARMGLNFLAQSANIANGIAMTNIEAAAGEYISIPTLLSADKAYVENIMGVVMEINSRTKTSKLGLFDEAIDLKLDFKGKTNRIQSKNWLKRLFGLNVMFLGMECGDHWLYNRVAIAMAKKEMVLVRGKKMSLWDALEVRDVKGSSNLKELNKDEIKNLDGSDFDLKNDFGRRVAEINHRLFGVYNEEDLNAAQRVAAGRLLMQFRKWMVPLYSARFRKAYYNATLKKTIEGHYVTLARQAKIFLGELKRGKFQLAAQWNNMKKEERANVKRALFEIFQLGCLVALVKGIEWPDDKKRPFALKLSEYLAKRELHELGGLVPSTIMIDEAWKTLREPVPPLGVVADTFKLFNGLLDPESYTTEMNSGPYKGLTPFEKNLMTSPIPGFAQYHQADKFTGQIDYSISYYVRRF